MSYLNWTCTRCNIFNVTFGSNSALLSVLWGQIAILFIICLTIACCLIFWFRLATTAIHMLRMSFSGIWNIANCQLVAFALLCVVLIKIFGPILHSSAVMHSFFHVFKVCPYPPLPPHTPGTLSYVPGTAGEVLTVTAP